MIDMTRYIVRLVPIGAGALFLATGSVVAQTTGGQDIGDLAVNLRGQLGDIGTLVGGISALAGICLSMICLFKLKEYNKNPQDPQNKLSTILVYGIVGVALIGLPEFMDVGLSTLFTGNPTTTDFDGSNLFN
ncbi:MAG: hypothetical protein OXH65_03020 [Paracoccaceae bacterium]|nr:hypothetical protein [Paracoccaceae bacterium]